MIVVTTSWAPTVALRKPAIPAQAAPASIASRMARTMCTGPARPASDEPTQTDTIAPMMYWPWPPMLKRPQRNAKATASPVRTSVAVISSVCCRLKAALSRSFPVVHGKSQLSPVPLKIPL